MLDGSPLPENAVGIYCWDEIPLQLRMYVIFFSIW